MSEIRLYFKTSAIRDEAEFLCLTDMWRAAQAPESKRPSDWLATESAKAFVAFIADNLDAAKTGNAILRAERGGVGGSGSTWGHWQLGMAYAQYLSPEFHAWCNDVVRKVMQGAAGVDVGVLAAVQTLAASVLEQAKAIAEIRTTISALSERSNATVTRLEWKSLAGRITRAGKLKAKLQPTRTSKAWGQRIRMHVTAAAGWSGSGCRYDNMPAHAYPQADRALSMIERELSEGQPPPRQLSFIKTA